MDNASGFRMETVIGNLLRIGVTVAASLVVAGGVLYLWHYGYAAPDLRVFRGEPEELRTAGGIIASAFSLQGKSLIQLGLLALIATPIARVALSVVAFARSRDRLYVGITLIVLALLLVSLLEGMRWP